MPYQAFVISHTHWDREWYQTFQEFRIRLVTLVDKLLDEWQRLADLGEQMRQVVGGGVMLGSNVILIIITLFVVAWAARRSRNATLKAIAGAS